MGELNRLDLVHWQVSIRHEPHQVIFVAVVREDLKKANEAAKRYRIDWFGKLSWRAYNHYLKSRGVKEGVKDYARGISLFTFLCRKGLAEVPIDTPAEAPAEPDAPEAPEEGAPPPEAPGPESAHGRAESS